MRRFLITVVLLGAGQSIRAQDVEQTLNDIQSPVVAATAPESILQGKPAGVLQRYLDKQADAVEQRDAKESAMDQVSAEWKGMVLREYALSADVRQALALDGTNDVTDMQARFPEISFGKGSYAMYRARMNGLFVLNTPKQIRQLEKLLASLETTAAGSQQVEIESRFVEFEQGALQELGLNWSDVADGVSAASAGQWAVKDGANLFSDSLRTLPYEQAGAVGQDINLADIPASGEWTARRLEDMFNGRASGTGAGEANISGSIGANGIDLLIRALDQTAGVDVLSSPRVVTVSGKEARIQVGQRHYYPVSYEAGVSVGTVVHVKYPEFEEKLLGVDMKVVPVVKDDEISLSINPKINDLVGWRQYELSPENTSYTYYQFHVGSVFEHERVVARLPVFKEREVKTDVVVRDGATVGMGGLISEKTESFSDRVPVLGSVPLIGRLFRSEGERNVKRNLMIFVTARRVQANGTVFSERSIQ